MTNGTASAGPAPALPDCNDPPLASGRPARYLMAMARAIRFLLLIAAMSIGWAPVAQTVHAAVAPGLALGFVSADAGGKAAAPLRHHDHMAGADRRGESRKAAPDHPAVCAACVGLPAVWAPLAQVSAEAGPTFGPLPALSAVLAAPASPPPRV